jgi:y4mF family transcriptional regulator
MYLIKFINLAKNHIIVLVTEVGIAIKKRRKALKITQPHLADLAGISVNSLYKIERGEANPTFDLLEKIAEVLGLEIKLEVKKITL